MEIGIYSTAPLQGLDLEFCVIEMLDRALKYLSAVESWLLNVTFMKLLVLKMLCVRQDLRHGDG